MEACRKKYLSNRTVSIYLFDELHKSDYRIRKQGRIQGGGGVHPAPPPP